MLLLLSLTAQADDYYIDDINGSDGNAGVGPFEAWKSINKIESFKFKAGDRVLFKRGGVWNDVSISIKVPFLTFGAYGDGPKPKLLGSYQVTKWAAVPGAPNVYSADVKRPPKHQTWKDWEVQLVMEDDGGFYKRESNDKNLKTLTPGTFVYNKSKQKLYIRPVDDFLDNKIIRVGHQENIFQIEHAHVDNLVIDGLNISQANRYGLGVWWQGDSVVQGSVNITNNEFIGNGFSAVCLSGNMKYDSIVVANNVIRRNGAEGIYIGKNATKVKLEITDNIIGATDEDDFGWRGEGAKSAFNGDGIDVKYGNRGVLIARNRITNLTGYCGVCYGSGDSVIEGNTIENIHIDQGSWPAGIMADIDDNYGTSIIRGNTIKGAEMYGINVRGKASIGPALVIDNNNIRLTSNNPFSQIGFTAMNSANVTIKNNNGSGGDKGLYVSGMQPKNFKFFNNTLNVVKTPLAFSNSKLKGLTAYDNYFCRGANSYILWGNGVKEKDLSVTNKYLANVRGLVEINCQ